MVDAQVGGTSQNYLWSSAARQLVQLERPGVGRHAAEAVGEHLVQPFGRLRRAGAGAGAQLRHAALVVAEVRDQQHAGRPEHGCTASEYGDSFDPMGGGCRHMNAWQKSYQGWLSSCNGVRVTNSGTFNLLPLEMACNGTQFLQIKAPKARPFMRPAAGGGGATTENLDYYYLELRTPVDFDGTLGGSALSARVLVHMATTCAAHGRRASHVPARHGAVTPPASTTPRCRSARPTPIRPVACRSPCSRPATRARRSS